MDFFSKPLDTVPVQQDRAIRALANVHGDLGENFTRVNITDVERHLTSELETLRIRAEDRPFFRAIIAQATALEPISSRAWNDAQKRIYVDLYALYSTLQLTSERDLYSGELTREKFLQTRAAILKIINEVRLYQFLKANPEYQDAKFINFHAALNETDKRPKAVVDSDVRLLELGPRSRDTQTRENFDLRSTQVEIQVLGGTPGGFHNDFNPERMLDANPESFWADMTVCDGPILQEYHPCGDGGLGLKIDSEGVLVHVILTLSHVGIANNLRILPFGEFPVRVIDIGYKESIAQGQWMLLPNFQIEEPTLDWIEVNFEPRTVAQLRITLEQTNYKLNTYHLPEHLVRNAVVWQQIGQESFDNTVAQVHIDGRSEGLLQVNPSELNRLLAIDDFRAALSIDLHSGTDRSRQYSDMASSVHAASEALSQPDPRLADEVNFPVFGTKLSTTRATLELKKYEYVYGLRSVELNNILYQPVGFYSSQKFVSDATVLDVGLTTEERHPTFNDGLGDYYKTSTEWEIELGRDRRFAIAPKNWDVEGDLVVPDEHLVFDRLTMSAVTRLPIADKATVLRKNGTRVRFDKYSVETLVTENPYVVNPVAPEFRNRNAVPVGTQVGRGLITFLDPDEYEPNAEYTLQYVAQPGSDELQIDGIINSTALLEPEVFEKTNRDHAILLTRFPYVDYNIVNSDSWTRDDDLDAKWRFRPTLPNYKSGTVTTVNGSPNITGSATQWLANIDMTEVNVFRIKGEASFYKIQSVSSDGLLTLTETYKGDSDSALEYNAGQYFESDGILYAFEQSVYEPVRVFVNDVKAYNLTDYVTLEHQAFTDISRAGRQYQYIHAGNVLYFNVPIDGARIEVYYSWLTEYVRVNAALRCNLPVQTVLTPQVNSARVELRTSKL